MNISNRLKKLESQLTKEDKEGSEFCACNEPVTERHDVTIRYDAYSTGAYVAYQHSEQYKADEAREKTSEICEICTDCNKPIMKNITVFQSIAPPLGQKHFHDRENKIDE